MNPASANYGMTPTLNTLGTVFVSNPANARASAATGTGGTTQSGSTGAGIGATFLNLLAQELEHQDPTAPMDSTAMVGQMISLSQLGQLVSIDQALTAASPVATGGLRTSRAATSTPVTATTASAAANLSGALPPSAGVGSHQLPFDPNTLMPLKLANAGTPEASINPSFNTPSISLAGTNNTSLGGK